MNKVIAIVTALSFATPALADNHRFGNHAGRDAGIGFSVLGLGILGAAFIAERSKHFVQTLDQNCVVAYDRQGNKVYDPDCFE